MTVPTTNVRFSEIQTEFGGTNPISMSEYYRGGANVPSGTATSAIDGVAISTSGTIRVGMFRGVSKVVPGIVNPMVIGNVDRSYISTVDRSVWINFYTDGDIKTFEHGNVQVQDTSWYTPDPTVGIGSSYWIRATLTSGLAPSSGPALNTWHALSAVRSWTYTAAGGGGSSTRSGTLLFEISSSSGGSPIVTSDSVMFSVNREV